MDPGRSPPPLCRGVPVSASGLSPRQTRRIRRRGTGGKLVGMGDPGAFFREFLGLDRVDPVAGGDGARTCRRRIYLDTTATALMSRIVWDGMEAYLAAA